MANLSKLKSVSPAYVQMKKRAEARKAELAKDEDLRARLILAMALASLSTLRPRKTSLSSRLAKAMWG